MVATCLGSLSSSQEASKSRSGRVGAPGRSSGGGSERKWGLFSCRALSVIARALAFTLSENGTPLQNFEQWHDLTEDSEGPHCLLCSGEHTGRSGETCTEVMTIPEVIDYGGLGHGGSSGAGKHGGTPVVYRRQTQGFLMCKNVTCERKESKVTPGVWPEQLEG